MTFDINFYEVYSDFTLDIALSLPDHGVTAIFGPSGSGKTSLLRGIAGLNRLRGGHILFDAEIWQSDLIFMPPHQRSIGYVFQESSLFDHMNVQKNLDYGQKRAKSPLTETERDHIIDLLGLKPLLHRKTSQLSGGERQRIAIARALLSGPQILLMDEPMASLDSGRKKDILSFLERLKSELNIPILYVSHNLNEVTRLADHLVIMDHGKVINSGPIREILSSHDILNNLGDDPFTLLFGRIKTPCTDHNLTEVLISDMVFRVPRITAQTLYPTENPTEYPTENSKALEPDLEKGRLLEKDQEIRLHLYAKDVSIACSSLKETSILNIFKCVIDSIDAPSQNGQCLVHLSMGNIYIQARISALSCQELSLEPKMAVFAQIKAVSFVQ